MLKNMITTRTSEEAAQAEAATMDRSGGAPGRMDQYFKQPDLPADFKFMEPYIQGNERDWK